MLVALAQSTDHGESGNNEKILDVLQSVRLRRARCSQARLFWSGSFYVRIEVPSMAPDFTNRVAKTVAGQYRMKQSETCDGVLGALLKIAAEIARKKKAEIIAAEIARKNRLMEHWAREAARILLLGLVREMHLLLILWSQVLVPMLRPRPPQVRLPRVVGLSALLAFTLEWRCAPFLVLTKRSCMTNLLR